MLAPHGDPPRSRSGRRRVATLISRLISSIVLLLPVAAVGADAGTGEHTFSTAATQGLQFEVLRCSFEVPATPVSFTSQSIFPWCGVQQTTGVTPSGDNSFGVLQPVLMFGDDCVSKTIGLGPAGDPTYEQHPYWYYSAQYVYPDPVGSTEHTCVTGSGSKASPGDVLVSTITYDPTTTTMTVTVSQQDGSGPSTYVAANPWLDAQQSWSSYLSQSQLEVSIEAWNASGSASWPATPASWPVTMTYEGAFPAEFAPKPKTVDVVPVTCGEPSLSDGSATVVCTYDLAATQSLTLTPPGTPGAPAAPGAPGARAGSTPSAPSAPVVTPRFTG
jgi:hypothetical protein